MGAPKKTHTHTNAGADADTGESAFFANPERIVLSERDFKMIIDAGENPRDLGDKMKKAWRDHQEAIKSGRIVVEGSAPA